MTGSWIITELINSILASNNLLSKENFKVIAIEKARRDLDKFGHNYWKAIAMISLIESDDFYEFAMRQEI